MFLTAHGLAALTGDATLVATGKLKPGKASLLAASEQVKACASKAGLVGKWFAGAGDAATVYQMWGVRP